VSSVSSDALFDSLPARSGHFRMESGYHTNLWLTLDAMFTDPHAIAPLIKQLADRLRAHRPDAICGPFLGGAFLAHALAIELGVHFYYAEPAGNADGIFKAKYALPAELQRRARGQRVVVVDDAISAGSSVRATAAALTEAGAHVVAIGTLLLTGTVARDHFEREGIPLEALLARDIACWHPDECPLCSAGAPLTETA
jgi:orotate phosphoribosyltransferase